jgi:hypothetical protein
MWSVFRALVAVIMLAIGLILTLATAAAVLALFLLLIEHT